MGGAGPDGEFLVVGDHPLFDPGDREILLVEGNGRRTCPLVGRDRGRYRLIGGMVFDDDGQEVVRTPDGAVALGRFHTLREVLTHRLPSGLVLGRVDVVDPDGEGRIPEQRSPGRHLSAEAFRELLRDAVDRLHRSEELARLAPVPSADIREDFVVGPSPVRAFEHDTPPRSPRIRSLEDLFEERLLRRNDDDPVLSEHASRLIRKLQQLEWERRSRSERTRR